jgi:hypothetical protein
VIQPKVLHIIWSFSPERAVDRNAGTKQSPNMGSPFFGHTNNAIYNKQVNFNAF